MICLVATSLLIGYIILAYCENALELVADSIFNENERENNYDEGDMDLVYEEEEDSRREKKQTREKQNNQW